MHQDWLLGMHALVYIFIGLIVYILSLFESDNLNATKNLMNILTRFFNCIFVNASIHPLVLCVNNNFALK